MKLGIQLLDASSSLNGLRFVTEQTVRQGETAVVNFQIVDLDQKGLRYIPGAGSTAFIEIPRFPQAVPSVLNQRTVVDYSVRKYASLLYPNDDRSCWTFPLSTTETANMMSSGFRVTITDGLNVKIAYLSLAFRVFPSEVPSS